MIIDVHTHPFCRDATVIPNLKEAIERMFGSTRNPQRLETIKKKYTTLFREKSVADIIADMDEAGVDKICIVAMDMSTQYGVVMVTNEDVSRLAALYPDRFIPFASVDPSLGSMAIEQLVHAVKDLGCKGVKLVPPVQRFNFSDPKHFNLWEAALEMDIVVWTHAAHQLSHPGSDARLGNPMLVEPVALRYPDLKIVLGHCGFPWVFETWSLVLRHPNVYVDISAYPRLYHHFPFDMYSAYAFTGAEEKMLFATDYPIITFEETLVALDKVDISLEFKKKILGENARRLMKLP